MNCIGLSRRTFDRFPRVFSTQIHSVNDSRRIPADSALISSTWMRLIRFSRRIPADSAWDSSTQMRLVEFSRRIPAEFAWIFSTQMRRIGFFRRIGDLVIPVESAIFPGRSARWGIHGLCGMSCRGSLRPAGHSPGGSLSSFLPKCPAVLLKYEIIPKKNLHKTHQILIFSIIHGTISCGEGNFHVLVSSV